MPEAVLRPTLRRGSKGPSVTELQDALNGAGAQPPLVPDGDFGPKTLDAVLAFQTQRGLVVDGIVGPQTWAALDGSTAPAPPTPVPMPPSPMTADWTVVPADGRMLYAMEILVNAYGYPVNGAAGLVGNLHAESGVIPNRLEGSQAASPMRAPDFVGRPADFTADQVMNRNGPGQRGPRLPGVGLAQWTSANRRAGLFGHAFRGIVLGSSIVFDMDAQLDYLVNELGGSFVGVNQVIRNPTIAVDAASDEVVYRFEVPGAVLANGALLPRTDPRVQAVFAQRLASSQAALRAYRAVHP
ncbi:MAG: phage tail tip lysozyme [bacterium]